MIKLCAECRTPLTWTRLRCEACTVLVRRARARAYYNTPEGAKKVLESRYRWVAKNRDKQRAYISGNYYRNKAKGITPYLVRKGLASYPPRPPVLTLQSVVRQVQRADYGIIDALVPRGVVDREDVIQDVALAVMEGRVSVDELRSNPGLIRRFTGAHRKASFELGGYAVSLDAPMRSGQSWHDVLAAS
jgi:hypothetical protein